MINQPQGPTMMTGLPTLPIPAPAPSVLDPDSQAGGQIRDWTKVLAGALVVSGGMSQSSAAMWAQVIASALIMALSSLWSVMQRKQTGRIIAVAPVVPADATRPEILAAATAPPVSPLLASLAAMSDGDKQKLKEALGIGVPPPPAK